MLLRVIGGKVKAGNRHPRVRTGLYRIYDIAGVLLYVGISGDPAFRQSQHAADKPWWHEVDAMTVEWFNNREAAAGREGAAIRREKPKYNIKHNKRAA